ncbi:MAG: ABA4-like family protein [Arenicellales bacterium]|jgi:hypothetical protein
MNAETLFTIVNTAILPAWLLLLLAPRWHWTNKLIGSGAVSFVFALVYTVLIIMFIGQSEGSFSSLAGVQQLFSNPYLLIAGWVHYLAFDLLVGSWIVKDAQEKQIRHGWIVPILVMTFMFGPLGWASYVVLRNWTNGVKNL